MRAKREEPKPSESLSEHTEVSLFKDSLGVAGRSKKWKEFGSWTQLGSWGEEGDTPVNETEGNCESAPKYHGTLEILWESG